MQRRNYTESTTQAAILHWLELNHPQVRECVIKIDNEGKRSFAAAASAKRCGLQAGASDLFIAWPTLEYSGCFIEVKPDGWTRSKTKKDRLEKQMNFLERMRNLGYFAVMVVGVDEGIAALTQYLSSKQGCAS